jgi:hypothetical protein
VRFDAAPALPAAPIQRSRRKCHCPFSRGYFVGFVAVQNEGSASVADIHLDLRRRSRAVKCLLANAVFSG